VIFSTTSLGLILPLVKEVNYKKEFFNIVLVSVMLVDIISVFLLSFSLAFIKKLISFSFIYSLILIVSLFLLPQLIRKNYVLSGIRNLLTKKSYFETEIRLAFALIVILSVISENLGFHSILGAFIAGLIIAEITPKIFLFEKKLESFGYGFFIPLFFIFEGGKINLWVLISKLENLKNLIVIVFGGLFSKFLGVALVSKIKGFNLRESLALGSFHMSRLSLIVGITKIAREMKLISEALSSSFMILAITSAVFGLFLGKFFLNIKKS